MDFEQEKRDYHILYLVSFKNCRFNGQILEKTSVYTKCSVYIVAMFRK